MDGKAGAAKKKSAIESLEKTLKLLKGTIKESKDWGVKELAYKIGKSEMGLYLFFEIELEPAGVKALNDKLKNDPDIIRFLMIKSESRSTKSETK